ncbi:MAG: beta-ketoacyl synthase [Chitinivibrionales bacterium]|nr:beta-ketoacyl synthase [Chitinivibrionales bacterium]
MQSSIHLRYADIITPFGFLDETVDALLDGKSAVRTGPCFDHPVAFAPFEDDSLRSLKTSCRTLAFRARKGLFDLDPAKTVFVYACAKGDISPLEEVILNDVEQVAFSPCLQSQAAVAEIMLGGPFADTLVISNACASGTIGVEVAHELLGAGYYDHAVCFGCDFLYRFVVSGFYALGALSASGARPFDAHRDGLTPGESAALAILDRTAEGTNGIEILAAASTNDANHRTGPSRTGEGLYRAARQAVELAGIAPGDIGGVKCHGTATPYNDAMEAKALLSLFEDAMPPVVSVKGALGHSSGAGSLCEMIMTAEFCKKRCLPPTINFQKKGVEEPLRVAAHKQALATGTVLCLAAGFGGVNSAVILKDRSAI